MADKREVAVPTIQLESDRFIVTEWRFAPAAETTWHRHEFDYIVVPLTSGRLRIETVASESVFDLVAGVSYDRSKGVEHNVINDNDYEFVFVEIELK